MSTNVLICDDSNLARKQTAKSLPKGWDVEVHFACHGGEAIEQIQQGKADVLLLDLNMPVMDGYEVLQKISELDLPTMVVVVSGDVQPEARMRVRKMGALDFIKKPVNSQKLAEILRQYGIVSDEVLALSGDLPEQKAPTAGNPPPQTAAAEKAPDPTLAPPPPMAAEPQSAPVGVKPEPAEVHLVDEKEEESGDLVLEAPAEPKSEVTLSNDLRDCLQEISNVAMGQAADLLARLLGAFVQLPIPNVNLIEVSELHMALKSVEDTASTSGVCQGFIGPGVAGEALLILNDSSFSDIARLLEYKGELNDVAELELLMDVANILIGACLKGFSEQIDIGFSQGHPVVLGQHCSVSDLIKTNQQRWQKTLAIEISYAIENYDVKCDLLFLITEDSLDTLSYKLSYLLED